MQHVTILAIEHGLASSITIPLEMIQAADIIERIRDRQAKRQRIVIAAVSTEPVTMTGGIVIKPAVSIAAIESTDLIFVPALWGNPNVIVKRYPLVTSWLQRHYNRGATICSVGTGSYFLAAAGLLDRRNATTHWYYFDDFQARYPLIKLQRKRFITHADRLYCTGSVNAVRDVMLHFVEQLFSSKVADEVSHQFTHELKRSYESMLLGLEESHSHHDELIIKIQEWLQRNYQKQVKLADVARLFDVSTRSFNRRFRAVVDKSPMEYLQDLRLNQAKSLLKHSNLSIAEIAFAVGYQDNSYFSSLFKRINTITPNEYRHLVRNKLFNVDTTPSP